MRRETVADMEAMRTIGRPTDVIGGGAASRRHSLFFGGSSSPTSPGASSPDKRKWALLELLGRVGDRKGKARVRQ